jgi:hypothetical protein
MIAAITGFSADYQARLLLESNPRIAVNKADPIIAHSSGKLSPWTDIDKGSGRPNDREIQTPKKAPINPTTMDIKQPPTE